MGDPTSYRLERSTDGVTWAEVATLSVPDQDETNTGLTEATLYYYRVIPINSAGSGPPSNVVSGTTDTLTPSAPGSPAAVAVSTTSIDVSWTISALATSYRVERSANGTTGWTTAGTVSAPALAFTDTGLTDSTTYYYRVYALNGATLSAASSVVNATTNTPPDGVGARVGQVDRAGATIGISQPGGSTLVRAGIDNLTTMVAAATTGQVFWLNAGTHTPSGKVVPTANNIRITGAVGAIIDGSNSGTIIGGNSATATGVTIDNIKFINCAPITGQEIISFSGLTGWTVKYCEIDGTLSGGAYASGGIAIGPNALIQYNYIHDIYRLGIRGWQGDGAIIEYNEFANNCREAWNSWVLWFECGDFKATDVSNLTFRKNYCHDTRAWSFWTDYAGTNIIVEDNWFESVWAASVQFEVTEDATCRYNTFTDCICGGSPGAKTPWSGGDAGALWMGVVYVYSAKAHVHNNESINCTGGVGFFQSVRKDAPWITCYGSVVEDNEFGVPNIGYREGLYLESSTDDTSGKTPVPTNYATNWFAGSFSWTATGDSVVTSGHATSGTTTGTPPVFNNNNYTGDAATPMRLTTNTFHDGAYDYAHPFMWSSNARAAGCMGWTAWDARSNTNGESYIDV